MADIALRFNKDMLVISSAMEAALERRGVDAEIDLEFIGLIEPDTIADIYRLELAAGAQCIATGTKGITPARLAAHGMRDRGLELATAALTIAKATKAQHILAEIGPCELPIDDSSAASLKENRVQYERAALALGFEGFDAFLLSDFTKLADLKCAIAGIRKVSDMPILCTVALNRAGLLAGDGASLAQAIEAMTEFQADVCGFSSAAPLEDVCTLAKQAAKLCGNPLMVDLKVKTVNAKQGMATDDNPYFSPDTMIQAAMQLYAAGVQFLRASGNATPAYTATLAAIVSGHDVVL